MKNKVSQGYFHTPSNYWNGAHVAPKEAKAQGFLKELIDFAQKARRAQRWAARNEVKIRKGAKDCSHKIT